MKFTETAERPLTETQIRFFKWASLPATDVSHFKYRQEAWDLYCDSRDGLLDGTSKNRFSNGLQALRAESAKELQSRRVYT